MAKRKNTLEFSRGRLNGAQEAGRLSRRGEKGRSILKSASGLSPREEKGPRGRIRRGVRFSTKPIIRCVPRVGGDKEWRSGVDVKYAGICILSWT